MDENSWFEEILVQLAEAAMSGKEDEARTSVRRLIRRSAESNPALANRLSSLLKNGQAALTRGATASPVLPVDADSRLELARVELIKEFEIPPILTDHVRIVLERVVAEHGDRVRLLRAGVDATRTMLFTGPPGVGKTYAARWLAHRLGWPLITLDLSAVMSSFLGRTGANLRRVIDYARGTSCVLLLDEFDAIAKRRDDATEVGELKRLVTVLLQEIDNWPADNLLIAATNHPALLDPAVWRRFEARVDFPLPSPEHIGAALRHYAGTELGEDWFGAIATVLAGASFSEIEQIARMARRLGALGELPVVEAYEGVIRERVFQLPHADRIDLAVRLANVTTQRRAAELTGVSRDTIRNRLQSTQ